MFRNKNKLQRMVFISFTVYALMLALCIGTVVVTQDIRIKREESHTAAFAFTNVAAEFINGDRLGAYIASGEKDEYYYQVESYLNANVNNSNLSGFYIVLPRENDILFLWDVTKENNGKQLGVTVGYDNLSQNAKEYLSSILSKNPPERVITGYKNDVFIATACSPIFNSEGEPVAVVAADLEMPNVQNEIRSALVAVVVVIMILVLLSAFAFFVLARKVVVLPIQRLNDASKSMVNHLENNERPKLSIKTGNEIEELYHSFMQMYDEVKEYIAQLSSVTAEKERIGAELNVAARIQASMLPCIFPPFPNRKEFEIYADMNPAKEVGGDFYDFFMVDDEHLAIVVADVSGKGVPAALFMVIGKTLIKDHTAFHTDLGDVFTDVNEILCASNREEMFITAFEGVLNIKTGEFRYVNAGHEIPFICKKGGVYEPFKIKAGFVLAGMEGFRYKCGSLVLEPGDSLFQYTDGVTEAINEESGFYGMNRLERVLAKNSNQSPKAVLDAVKEDIDLFVGNALPFDDITMLCLKYKGNMNK